MSKAKRKPKQEKSYCLSLDCERVIPDTKLFCMEHWRRIPQDLREDLIEETYLEYFKGSDSSLEFQLCLVKAINSLALLENLITFDDAIREERRILRALVKRSAADESATY